MSLRRLGSVLLATACYHTEPDTDTLWLSADQWDERCARAGAGGNGGGGGTGGSGGGGGASGSAGGSGGHRVWGSKEECPSVEELKRCGIKDAIALDYYLTTGSVPTCGYRVPLETPGGC